MIQRADCAKGLHQGGQCRRRDDLGQRLQRPADLLHPRFVHGGGIDFVSGGGAQHVLEATSGVVRSMREQQAAQGGLRLGQPRIHLFTHLG